MEQYISKDALVAEIEKRIKGLIDCHADKYDAYSGEIWGLKRLLSFLDTLEVKECETKSGIVQKDLQIVLDDGNYIDLDPSMQLKPSFSVKEGERVKVVISKED